MNIYEAICAIMVDTEAIKKDKKNTQQNFNFRGIDDVYNAIHPLLAKHGVFSVPKLLSIDTEERTTNKGTLMVYRILKIQYTFYASDGTFVEAVVPGEANDSGDKASSKAMAIGHKYALLQILSIPTEDMQDPDASAQPKDDLIVGKNKTEKAVDDAELRARARELLDKSSMPAETKARWIEKFPTLSMKAIDGLLHQFRVEGLIL
jgi:hypothetical protein